MTSIPRIFHYTYAHKLKLIDHAGGLSPSKPGARVLQGMTEVSRFGAEEEPVLWFSSNLGFEKTALKPMQDRFGNVQKANVVEHAKSVGLVRFELTDSVGLEVWPWAALKSVARISSVEQRKMEKRGREVGSNPSEWYGVLVADYLVLPLRHLSIQYLDVSGVQPIWRPTTLDQEIQKFESKGLTVQSV